jgi:F0F1-type ATP synthase assembly protein I
MTPNKINIQRAALFGLLFGMAFGVLDNFAELGSAPLGRIVGWLIGGGFAGALLFAGIAAIANLFRK